MKQFSCGEVVPGCKKSFQAESVEAIMSAVAEHAREEHNMTEIPPALVEQVRSRIQDVRVA